MAEQDIWHIFVVASRPTSECNVCFNSLFKLIEKRNFVNFCIGRFPLQDAMSFSPRTFLQYSKRHDHYF